MPFGEFVKVDHFYLLPEVRNSWSFCLSLSFKSLMYLDFKAKGQLRLVATSNIEGNGANIVLGNTFAKKKR